MAMPLFILMIIAGIGAAVGMRLSKSGKAHGQIIAGVCAFLAVVLAVAGLLTRDKAAPALVKSLNRYSYSAGYCMGRHLAEDFSGSRALLLVEPIWPGEDPDVLQVAIEEGLRQGMGSDMELVDVVPVAPPPGYTEAVRKSLAAGNVAVPSGVSEDWIPALERDHNRWFNAQYFASLLASRKGTYDVLVSAVGVPRGFAGPRAPKNLPKTIAVLNAPDLPMARLVDSGIVDAVVVMKPSANPWKDANAAPADIDEAFDKRFLLVTRENFKEMAQAYPNSPNLR